MVDFNDREVHVGDRVIFNVPHYKELQSSQVIKLTPKGIKINYIYSPTGSVKEAFIAEKQFVIDAVPVVHGQWIDSPNIIECVVCSNCMSDNLSAQIIAPPPPWYKYCPNCGCKMDGQEDATK